MFKSPKYPFSNLGREKKFTMFSERNKSIRELENKVISSAAGRNRYLEIEKTKSRE